jgi:hypothetical protein
MSYHPKIKETKCKKCSAVFIPFKKNFTCPKCNEPTEIFIEFIPSIITAMSYHKGLHGCYFPLAWFPHNLSDQILGNIFLLFDTLENEKPDNPKKFIMDKIEEGDWGKDKYFKKHIKDIALEVYKVYKLEKLWNIKKPKKRNIFYRIFHKSGRLTP